MAIRFILNDTDGVDADTNGDVWIVREDIELSNTGDAFDFLNFTGVDLIVQGSIYSETDAIDAEAGASGARVTVAETGFVWGFSDGIELFGANNAVTNLGEVHGLGDRAIQMGGANGTVLNSGYVRGETGGIESGGADGRITNSGEVVSTRDAVDFDAGGRLVNSGRIEVLDTTSNAVGGSGEVETVRNSGLIIGDVVLGGGGDFFSNAGGGRVDGVVRGSEGKDTLLGGSEDDQLNGGNAGDLIRGRAGDDDLVGGGGKDEIHGDRGDDFFTGGDAGDTFVFAANGGFDTITDLQGIDRIDLTRLGLKSFANSIAPNIENVKGGSLIDLADDYGLTIFVEDVNPGQLTFSDFII